MFLGVMAFGAWFWGAWFWAQLNCDAFESYALQMEVLAGEWLRDSGT